MMGNSTRQEEAAPAYEELFHNQPSRSASSRTRRYDAVPQDDVDDQQPINTPDNHIHILDQEAHGNSTSPPVNVDLTGPHFHCDVCDRHLERRERRSKEQCCCLIVALTFMAAFVCITVVVGIIVKAKSH